MPDSIPRAPDAASQPQRVAPAMNVRQYAIVTGNYWAFTLTDGALRMLVVLHFHELGYSPLQVALLFLFYEFFGVVTNLFGGWFAARAGLNRTMHIGLALQVMALAMLAVPAPWLTVIWVMAAQALSGIGKDLNKMSAKSAIKQLVPAAAADNADARSRANANNKLYRWVAALTGSKNALKGVGFFLGGLLLSQFGFRHSVVAMACALALVWLASFFSLQKDLGRAQAKPKFRDIFSKSDAVNTLSLARFFLFGARDVWFVVALPVYLSAEMGWDFWRVGGFLAVWVIGYGIVQSLAPHITHRRGSRASESDFSENNFSENNVSENNVSGKNVSEKNAVLQWGAVLAVLPAAMALGMQQGWPPAPVLIGGLTLFGAVFALNSSLHSYLIVSYAKADGVSLDVGFYYMANAMGRLAGTVLSGWLFQLHGLPLCLWVSAAMLAMAVCVSFKLPS